MIVTHKLKLDLANWDIPPRIDVMQGDKYSRNLEIQLYENKRELPLSEISNVLVRYVKPDHTGGTYDTLPDGSCAWSICENAMQIAIAPQVCTAPGLVQLVVCICSGDAELNSFLLELQVQKLPKGICSSQPYVNIKGFVPQPENAQIGQYLKVAEVDRFGKVTAVETAEGGGGAVAANVVTCDLEGAAEDESTVPLNADTLGGFDAGEYVRHSDFAAKDFTNLVAFSDLPAEHHESCKFLKIGDIVYLYYCGGNGTVSNGLNLCTIPAGYRPVSAEICTPFTINGVTYGLAKIQRHNGACIAQYVNSSSASGRVRFSTSYVCESASIVEVSE